MKNIFYFGLESVKARYTEQLSKIWMPSAFKRVAPDLNFVSIDPAVNINDSIKKGAVLDACNRGIYSMAQCQEFLNLIQAGIVQNDDVIFFQDFWTPGFESILYALDLYNIKVKIYSMLHAQSIDEYDFTYNMKTWMRPIEIGFANKHDAIFVGSTIHRDQLKSAGFECPIHVVSLPYGLSSTLLLVKSDFKKEKKIIFASRLDKEKNPYFLYEVITKFLSKYKDYKFVMTTSGSEFRSNISGVVNMFKNLALTNNRFVMLNNLSKEAYYNEIATSEIMFNSSLQDYVSWTSIEANTFDTKFIAPNFRSFPDFCSPNNLYMPFDIESAISLISNSIEHSVQSINRNIANISDTGRLLEAAIVAGKIELSNEINIWHEFEYCKHLLRNINE